MDIQKLHEENRRRNAQKLGECPYCLCRNGTPKFNATHGWADNVCKTCRAGRDWIARVAVVSPKVVEYVLKRMDEWAAERAKAASVPPAAAEDRLDRLERLESMMQKMMQEFGVK